MSTHFAPPSIEQVRETLASKAPELAGHEIKVLGEGWDFITFRAGDQVVRFPKVDAIWTMAGELPLLERLQAEAQMQQDLARTLPLPIPLPRVIEGGPGGLPFTLYEMVPGVPLGELQRPAGRKFAATYATLIRALQSFPVSRLRALGFQVRDGAETRRLRIGWYEMLVRRAFPLMSCEARTFTIHRFETYLNEPRNFEFEPVLSHSDLDQRNVLADPETGELSGVVDFGDALAGDPAFDFCWALMGGFESLGIAGQLPRFFEAVGTDEAAVRAQCEFYDYCWPLYEIIHGLDREDPDEVEDGILYLNKMVPFGTRC